ncbi:MAG: DUF45 domain-containing protein [Proteobacteria bacterium]|nr:MAG: DUF45 domain-containing protein [Pseudomonadota bacterium]
METFKIGKTEVPVSIELNKRLKSRRLSVSPSGVLVEAPENQLGGIDTFLEAKSSWIFGEWQKLRNTIKQTPWPEEFTTGAKVLFLGRYTPINVSPSERELEVLKHTERFDVKYPTSLNSDQKKAAIKGEFVELFSEVLSEMATTYGKVHGFNGLKIQINQRQDRWAACKQDNTIVLGWDLIFLPKPVIEYVIVHELVHIQERNHSQDFWSALSACLPDYREREATLSEYEMKISFREVK